MERYSKDGLVALLPIPARDANKYSRGRLMLFAGSATYPGAACLAAGASQRCGTGYTEVITSPSIVSMVQAYRPSLVVRSRKNVHEDDLPATGDNRPCAYVVGPGFDAAKEMSHEMTAFVLKNAKAPVLIDGGALDTIATDEGHALCQERFVNDFPTIITPHQGEAARLAEAFNLKHNEPDQLAFALSLAYGTITVLKGPQTYISDGDEIFVVSNGTPALAKAGTGDVLSGVIGAFLAQGLAPLDASILGVTLHARAGVLAADELTSVSVTAEDVIDYLPCAVSVLSSKSDPNASAGH